MVVKLSSPDTAIVPSVKIDRLYVSLHEALDMLTKQHDAVTVKACSQAIGK